MPPMIDSSRLPAIPHMKSWASFSARVLLRNASICASRYPLRCAARIGNSGDVLIPRGPWQVEQRLTAFSSAAFWISAALF